MTIRGRASEIINYTEPLATQLASLPGRPREALKTVVPRLVAGATETQRLEYHLAAPLHR